MSRALAFALRPLPLVAGAACAAGIAAWLWHRHNQAPAPVESAAAAIPERTDELEESPPDSFSFEPERESTRALSARPSGRNAGYQTPDEYDALAPEELGAAFLAGATDTALDEPPSSTAELSGFQIFDRDAPDYQPDDELADEELAEIFDRRG